MKTKLTSRLLLAVLCGGLLLPAAVQAQAHPFTYQGKMERDGAPFTGNIDVVGRVARPPAFAPPAPQIYNLVWSEEVTNVPVQNGIFTVNFQTAEAADFPTGPLKFNLMVRTSGEANYTALSYENLAYAPFAFRAEVAGAIGDGGTSQVNGTLNFSGGNGQKFNLYTAQYGIGVQDWTLYQRSAKDFSWYVGGVHDNGENNPGTGGKSLMELSDSLLMLKPGVTNFSPQGPIKVGCGDRSNSGSGNPYVSVGEGDTDDELELIGKTVKISQQDGILPATVKMPAGSRLYFGPSSVGYSVEGISNAILGFNSESFFFSDMDGVRLARLNGLGNLSLKGTVFPNGADVAEGFEMSETTTLEPGTVVAIDAENPGKLKQSAGAYDKRVAGIISGAGGVKPGLRLGQPGVLDGDHDVSLSGRVYVKADAGQGAIQAGDMLTTSDTPGHAMKVTDHARAQGSILGKAMSNLDSGTGMVLVLVTLQ